MKTLTNPLALALLAVAGLLAATGSASAQDYKRVHRLARVIEQHAHELFEELDDHFKPTPAFKRLHQHAREIEQLAQAVHKFTDVGNRKGMRVAVERLEEEINQFVRVAENARDFGKVSPQAYAHLRREARYLHEAVRDMRQEVH
jgi:uncharacterized membrane protein YccC